MKKLVTMMVMIMMTTAALFAKESKYTAEEKTAIISVYNEKKAELKKPEEAYDKVYNEKKEAYASYEEAYDKYKEAYDKYKEALDAFVNNDKNTTAYRKYEAAKDSYKFYCNNLARKEKALDKKQKALDKAYDKYKEASKSFQTFCDENKDIIKEYFEDLEEKFNINKR